MRKRVVLFYLLGGLFISSTFHIFAVHEPAAPIAVRQPATSSRHCLWKAQGASNVVYLLGSMHELREDAYPLPQVMESAFTNCRIVVFETDLAEQERPETHARLLKKVELPRGQTLKNLLKPKIYASFSNRVQEIGLSMSSSFDSLKPVVAMEKLDLFEIASLGALPEYGVDVHFFKSAQHSGMKIIPLESADFAVDLLTSFSKAQEELFVEKSLEQIDDEMKKYDELLVAWQNGDAAGLEKLLNKQRRDEPAIFKKLVTDRTAKWMPEIEELLQGSQNAIVIVGAGHLVGPDGMVELLKKKGRNITQL
jgi:uncharacterized protein YbaP (TraB family)